MVSIIRASEECEGTLWVAYDVAFIRQVAATGLREWVNTTLGERVREGEQGHCLRVGHRTGDCYALREEEDNVSGRVKAVGR